MSDTDPCEMDIPVAEFFEGPDEANHFSSITWKNYKSRTQDLTWHAGKHYNDAWTDGVFIFVYIGGETRAYPIDDIEEAVLE